MPRQRGGRWSDAYFADEFGFQAAYQERPGAGGHRLRSLLKEGKVAQKLSVPVVALDGRAVPSPARPP
jgi:hypothetical protein